jgi:hypothetical protein
MLDFVENQIIIPNITNTIEKTQKINLISKKKIKITGTRKIIPIQKKD